MKRFLQASIFAFVSLTATVASAALCTLGLGCTSCNTFQQAYQEDLDGQCYACAGLCKYYAPAQGDQAKASQQQPVFVPFAKSGPDIRIPISTIKEVAATNLWAAVALYQAQLHSDYMDTGKGEMLLNLAPTEQSFQLRIAGADLQVVKAAMVELPAEYRGQVAWYTVDAGNGARQIVIRSSAIDSNGNIAFDVYPAVAIDIPQAADGESVIANHFRSLE